MVPFNTTNNNALPPLMLATAACGFPSPAEHYIDSALDLNELLGQKPAATYFVRAAGDSMINAGIAPGDILIVDRSQEPFDGCIVIAAVDNEFTVKYFRKNHSEVYLEPANERYSNIYFSEGMTLQIFGVVTSCIRRFSLSGKNK